MFKAQFAAKVRAGTKRCTIRPEPKRAIIPGDTIDCREWTGKPYRSKQAPLRCGRVMDVAPICVISAKEIRIWHSKLDPVRMMELAEMDGFESVDAMVEFFEAEHGLPFDGVLIQWDPTFSKAVANG